MKKLSWDEVEKTAEELANRIKASKFNPDYIIGVTTGGLFPLALLSKQLKLKNILTLTARKTIKDKKETVTISHLPRLNLKGKKLLLVDEIAQSGITLKKISNILQKEYSVKVIKTATLAANSDACKFWPDYYVLIEQGDWVKFPWEKEDFPPYSLKE